MSAVLGFLEEDPEAGIWCKWLTEGELLGEKAGGERAEGRGKLRRMRSQPEMSHSLIPRGALKHVLHPRVRPRPRQRGWPFGTPGPVGPCPSAARGKDLCHLSGDPCHQLPEGRTCVISRAKRLPFTRGNFPEKEAAGAISSTAPPPTHTHRAAGRGVACPGKVTWRGTSGLCLTRLTSWPSRARLCCRRRAWQTGQTGLIGTCRWLLFVAWMADVSWVDGLPAASNGL